MNTPVGAHSLFAPPAQAPHEQITLFADEASGLRTIIAIHSTARGPAFGGCRLWQYAGESDAVTDALRLSHGMSLKNALAGLPFGGGKAVIIAPSTAFDRAVLFEAFGRAVDRLHGRYITAEDVGSTTSDMRTVAQHTRFVSGMPRESGFGGDPSPKTAYGVFVAIEEAARQHLRRPLTRVSVAVQGLGAVGMALCRYLHAAGAKLVVADVNAQRTQQAVAEFGARASDPEAVLAEPVDVLAPCALGGVINGTSTHRIQAAVVAGAANNQLLTPEDGDRLHARGVLYLPDFLVNAGGIISVAREYLGTGDEQTVMFEVSGIRRRVAELLERAAGAPPARVAEAWATERLQTREMSASVGA